MENATQVKEIVAVSRRETVVRERIENGSGRETEGMPLPLARVPNLD